MKKEKLNRLKIVLAELEIPNTALAEGLSVTKSTVSRWVTNDMQPSLETLFLIAKFLDVDVRELIQPSKK